MDFNDDILLYKLLKSGDDKAYHFLMDNYYKKLCAYAYVLTNDYKKSEDIVQQVFVNLWVRRKKMDITISIKSYLYRAVYNCFIDQHRKYKNHISLENSYIEAMNLIVEDDQRDKQDLENLIKAVNKEIDLLPEKCRNIFLLNKKEGLTQVEISKYLGISVKTVEGHITRAFKILSEKLRNT